VKGSKTVTQSSYKYGVKTVIETVYKSTQNTPIQNTKAGKIHVICAIVESQESNIAKQRPAMKYFFTKLYSNCIVGKIHLCPFCFNCMTPGSLQND